MGAVILLALLVAVQVAFVTAFPNPWTAANLVVTSLMFLLVFGTWLLDGRR